MSKKIIVNCCEKIIVDEKDINKSIYREKGYEFELKVDSQYRYFYFKTDKYRDIFIKYKLQEDIKLKYIICPICNEKIWLNSPWFSDRGIKADYKVIKLTKRYSEWEDYYGYGDYY